MAKLICKKSKSFTLLEVLISVSIFTVVVVMVVAVLSITVSSKSKVQAINQLRTEGGKVMVEIQDMVEKANLSFYQAPPPVYWFYGLAPLTTGTTRDKTCTPVGGSNNNGLESQYVDYADTGGSIPIVGSTRIFKDGTRLRIGKTINALSYSPEYLTPPDIEVVRFEISGYFRGASCTAESEKVDVLLEIRGKSTGYVGDVPSITLQSTFTSKYPGPDMAGDSRSY